MIVVCRGESIESINHCTSSECIQQDAWQSSCKKDEETKGLRERYVKEIYAMKEI